MCVCVWKKHWGQPTDSKNCWISMEFSTIVPCVNTWGCFLIFWKFHFWVQETVLIPKCTKHFLGTIEMLKILDWLIFDALVPCMNIWGVFFHSLEFSIWGSIDSVPVPKWTKNLKWLNFVGNFIHLFVGFMPRVYLIFWKFLFLGLDDSVLVQKWIENLCGCHRPYWLSYLIE